MNKLKYVRGGGPTEKTPSKGRFSKFAERKKDRNAKLVEIKKDANTDHNKPCKCSGNSITRSVGEIVILVRRTSFEIPFDLPYCIWGTLYLNANNFSTVLQPYLPAGVTVTTQITSAGIEFTYVSGILTDTIIVRVPAISLTAYPQILASLNTFFMRSEFAVFNCNEGVSAPALTNDQIIQLQSGGLYMLKSTGGQNKDAHLIIPLSRKQINNSVIEMTELYLRNEEIKPDTVWVHQFAYPDASDSPPAGIRFSFCVFINEKIDMNRRA